MILPPQHILLLLLVLTATIIASTDATGNESATNTVAFRVEETTEPAGWQIMRGDQVVAGYISKSNDRPVVYPVVGPGGHEMTRAWPLEEANEHERKDHPHHRSLWLTHGDVNGIDFWHRGGEIVQRSGGASVAESGAAVIVTHNDWISRDGEKVLEDTRRFAFHEDGGRYLIDCDFLLKATNGDVNFGDTKEGSFGVRVAGSMKVSARLGGQITNADGKVNGDAWGKKSPWVDYSGPVDGDPVGITIHDHPSSFGFPCRWHVRTYGLFAANPFGVHHFTGGERTDGIVLKEGTQMRLNYRVVLHEGELDAEQAKQDQERFANDPRPELE